MGQQLTVRLPDELYEALSAAANISHRRRSEIVRMALRNYLTPPSRQAKPAELVSDLLGSLESGIPDLAEDHRRYILESLKNGW